MPSKNFKTEVYKGLSIVEYLNKAFGEGCAKLEGNGNTIPHRLVLNTDCEMIKRISRAYNTDTMMRWIIESD